MRVRMAVLLGVFISLPTPALALTFGEVSFGLAASVTHVFGPSSVCHGCGTNSIEATVPADENVLAVASIFEPLTVQAQAHAHGFGRMGANDLAVLLDTGASGNAIREDDIGFTGAALSALGDAQFFAAFLLTEATDLTIVFGPGVISGAGDSVSFELFAFGSSTYFNGPGGGSLEPGTYGLRLRSFSQARTEGGCNPSGCFAHNDISAAGIRLRMSWSAVAESLADSPGNASIAIAVTTPEPTTGLLVGFGLVLAGLTRRGRRG